MDASESTTKAVGSTETCVDIYTPSKKKAKTIQAPRMEEVMILPASIWALILSNYCSFRDVRHFLSVNSSYWRGIPPLMERLHIFDAQELHPGYATRFPRVKKAFVYSLTSLSISDNNSDSTSVSSCVEDKDDHDAPSSSGEDSDDDTSCSGESDLEVDESMSFCQDTARNVVSWLESFPRLEFVHIGGYTPRHPDAIKLLDEDKTHCDLSYANTFCKGKGHQEAFRGMLQSMCDAFARGSLPSNLHFSGLFDNHFFHKQLDCSGANRCQLCPQICQTFPLSFLARFGQQYSNDRICISEMEVLRHMHQRDNKFLLNSLHLPMLLLNYQFTSVRLLLQPAKNMDGTILNNEAECKMVEMIHTDEKVLATMELMCGEFGCDAATTPSGFLKEFSRRVPQDHLVERIPQRPYIARELFNRLHTIGYPLSTNRFQILVRSPLQGNFWMLERDFNKMLRLSQSERGATCM